MQTAVNKYNVLLVANSSWYIYNFRTRLIRLLQLNGYNIYVGAPSDLKYTKELKYIGCNVLRWKIDRVSTNPIKELRAIYSLSQIIKKVKPSVVLSFTPKGNIYSNVIGKAYPFVLINNVSGLGRTLTDQFLIGRLYSIIYKSLTSSVNHYFFQNSRDYRLFYRLGILKSSSHTIIPGSGVDVNRFKPVDTLVRTGTEMRFIFVGRMIKEKGVLEFIESAKILRQQYPGVSFYILGIKDLRSKSSISMNMIDIYVKDGLIKYLNQSDNVFNILREMDCLILPSYYAEGIPRSILEASSTGLPIITTNMPGCSDAVRDGVTGFLCRPQDPIDLAKKIEQMIKLSTTRRQSMGLNGRKLMISEFDEKLVLNAYISIINKTLGIKV